MKDCRRGFGCADFFILGINREIPRQIRLDKPSNDYSLGNLHPVHNSGQYNRCNRLDGVIVSKSLFYRKSCSILPERG